MKSHPNVVSRRGFLAQSAAAGALSCVGGVPAAASAAIQSGEESQVAPHYRGFLKKNITNMQKVMTMDIMKDSVCIL